MNYDLNDILERADPEELADRNIAEICDLVETLTHIVNNQQYTIEQQRIYIKALEGNHEPKYRLRGIS